MSRERDWIGALLGQPWGYVLFGAAGACSLYINIILRFTEKKHVYPALGPLKYFTYFWGFFVYWGALALAIRLYASVGSSSDNKVRFRLTRDATI